MATATDANGNKTVYNYDSRDGLTLVYGENAGGRSHPYGRAEAHMIVISPLRAGRDARPGILRSTSWPFIRQQMHLLGATAANPGGDEEHQIAIAKTL